VTPGPAAASALLGLSVFAAACIAAFAVASSANGAGGSWRSYVAPAGACAGADDRAAAPAAQQRAVGCLVNWARRQDRLVVLRQPRPLQRAAVLKGKRIASCGAISHAPCGSDQAASLRAAGYRYATFGENLLVGSWGQVAPRDVVAAWLASPTHRANILRPRFRDLGAALVRAPGLLGDGDAAVWVATFATRR
jgi:uncharacterized protein YkwD